MDKHYNEIKEEKETWDGSARTTQDDIALRGPLKNPVKRLEKSRAYIYKLFKKSGKKNLLLDIGCGNGLFTLPLADIFNFVVGLDISKEMIKRCKEKRDNLDFIMASATDLPLRESVFDAVMSVSVLQHVRPKSNVENILKEISRITASNSFVFLTFWDSPNSPTGFVKKFLKNEGYNLRQSLVSRFQFTGLRLTRYVKLHGYRC